jgi:hypothetical protein
MTEIIPLDRSKTGPAAGQTPRRRPTESSRRQVYVLFTDIDGTLSAVRVAARFALAFGGHVTVVHFRPLDFVVPLDAPTGISPAETEAFRERLSAEGCDVDITVCACRDARRALPAVIDAHSLVVVGGHRRWWPTGADRWRRRLEEDGYVVTFVNEAIEERQVNE